jgi:hypothetical protein
VLKNESEFRKIQDSIRMAKVKAKLTKAEKKARKKPKKKDKKCICGFL